MKLNNFDIVFSEVYKLAELILTFPSTTATAERSFSVLMKIYVKVTHGQVQLTNMAINSIQKNIFLYRKKWYEE